MEQKKLYKSETDKALFGVCGGFAEYFGIDSLIVRLLLVIFTLAYGSGLVFYIFAALLMPSAGQVRPCAAEAACGDSSGSAPEKVSPNDFRGFSFAQEDRILGKDDAEELAEKYREAQPAETSGKEPSGEISAEKAPVRGEYTAAQIPSKPLPGLQSIPRQKSESAYAKEDKGSRRKARRTAGAVLIGLGVLLFVKILLPWLSFKVVFAAGIIVAGAMILLEKE